MSKVVKMDYRKALLKTPQQLAAEKAEIARQLEEEKARVAKELEAKNIFHKLPRGMSFCLSDTLSTTDYKHRNSRQDLAYPSSSFRYYIARLCAIPLL